MESFLGFIIFAAVAAYAFRKQLAPVLNTIKKLMENK